jgi:hypothetical protein
MIIVGGLSGSTANPLRLSALGDMFVTGSLAISGTQTVTGSVGITNVVPILITSGTAVPIVTNTTPVATAQALVTRNIPNGTQTVAGSVSTYTQGPQAVSGSVSVYTQGAQLVSGSVSISSANVYTSGPQGVSGSVSVYTQGAQLVSGTVSISSANVYTSGLQGISGSVTVSNFPATQTVTGTITVNNPVSTVNQGTPGATPWLVTGSFFQTNFPVVQAITGTVTINNPVTTVNQGTPGASPWLVTGSFFQTNFPVVQAVTGTVQVVPSGVQTVTGSITIFAASGSYGGKIEGLIVDGGLDTSNPVMIGGSDGTNVRNLSVDSLGRLITAPAGSSTSVTSSLAIGYVVTAATTITSVRNATYTEQTTNAQRSLVSANAADTSAGTGARTVQIIYYDQSLNGPFTETVTLNGTVAVNTVATNICYIEQMFVITVGSGGTNAGIISLKAATAGGGATIMTIVAGDGRTFMAHHYVPVGKTCYITGLSVNHNGTTVGSGGLFMIKGKTVLTANAYESQISDFHRLYGQDSATTRNWGTPVKFVGPGRVTVYLTPETATSTTYRAAMDLYDQ